MLGVSASTGQPLSDLDHLHQSIRDILTTRIGTRVLCREYGSRLSKFIDNPTNPALEIELYAATADALARWEPRFRLERVQFVEVSPGKIVLNLRGKYIPGNTETAVHGVEVTI